jgi:predicted nucleic acid-binding Zn ribbon protein
MLPRSAGAQVPPETVRAPVVASPRATCEACGTPMAARKGKRACSGKCRALLSRRREDETRQARNQEICGLVVQAERLLAAARMRLEEG